MRAVHIESGLVAVKNVPKPACIPAFATIRLLYGGICNTDLELKRGYYGFRGTPGHEFVGEVVEAGDRSFIGKRVVGEINLACGKCEWCARGLGRHCPKRTVLGIVRHPGRVSRIINSAGRKPACCSARNFYEQAVFVEPLAAACEILDQVKIPKGAAAAVLGDGKLGLLIAQVLHAHGAEVHQYGRHREKLRISEAVGVSTEAAKKLPTAAYDWVVDATGSADGLKQAVSMTRPRGTLIMKSTVHGLAGIDTAPVIVNELTLAGSRCGRFEPALRLLRLGKVRVNDMISEVMPLEDAPQAFERTAQKGVLKVLLRAS